MGCTKAQAVNPQLRHTSRVLVSDAGVRGVQPTRGARPPAAGSGELPIPRVPSRASHRLRDPLRQQQPPQLGEALCFASSGKLGPAHVTLWQPPAHSLLRNSALRVQYRLALFNCELKISVLQVQTIEKQCLRKSSKEIHF